MLSATRSLRPVPSGSGTSSDCASARYSGNISGLDRYGPPGWSGNSRHWGLRHRPATNCCLTFTRLPRSSRNGRPKSGASRRGGRQGVHCRTVAAMGHKRPATATSAHVSLQAESGLDSAWRFRSGVSQEWKWYFECACPLLIQPANTLRVMGCKMLRAAAQMRDCDR